MGLKSSDNVAVKYHDIFDFKLTKSEALKWQYKQSLPSVKGKNQKKSKGQLQRERYSKIKLKIAKKASVLISKIWTVKFVGITGALAMNNAGKDDDIDLMIITKENTLWTTRLLVYIFLKTANFKIRSPRDKLEKDKLCINLWLDENDLAWNKDERNIYTAHEIAQVIPIVDKKESYQKFLWSNKWILDYWPNSVNIEYKNKTVTTKNNRSIIEKLAFNLQYCYTKNKITREVVTPTRAIFHPNDWGRVVTGKLNI